MNTIQAPGQPVRLALQREWLRAAVFILTLLTALAGWNSGTSAAEPFRDGPPQMLAAELQPDRVVITVAGQPFTEYLFQADSKYPYFFPVNGPRTGHSVTTCRTEPYPHHS